MKELKLTLIESDGGYRVTAADQNGNLRLQVYGAPSEVKTGRMVEIAQQHARRIVACVNACEGVPTDVLENTVQRGGALMYQQERRKAAEAQRDELLAALESLVLFTNPKPSNAVALNNAHQVIARVKGGAA